VNSLKGSHFEVATEEGVEVIIKMMQCIELALDFFHVEKQGKLAQSK
jgi:hypothetical protein